VRKAIEARASRTGGMWVASIPQHGVYGHGRTLRELRGDLTQGLALAGVTTAIRVAPVSPELLRLRRAKDAYDAALADAVTTLTADGSPARDVAEATEVPIAQVTAIRDKPKVTRKRTPRKRTAA
jgi:hypothetical protein